MAALLSTAPASPRDEPPAPAPERALVAPPVPPPSSHAAQAATAAAAAEEAGSSTFLQGVVQQLRLDNERLHAELAAQRCARARLNIKDGRSRSLLSLQRARACAPPRLFPPAPSRSRADPAASVRTPAA
jgi:hypothetical protein